LTQLEVDHEQPAFRTHQVHQGSSYIPKHKH